MATGLQTWSQTAASNATADSNVNWAEGMAASAVNDSARAEMASAAKWRDDNNATIVTGGSTTAYTATSSQVSTANAAGHTVAVQFHATNDSSATLNVDGCGALPMQLAVNTNLAGGEFPIGSKVRFCCSSGSSAWVAMDAIAMGSQPNIVSTTNITNSAVTYAKIQNESNNTLLGNVSGGAAAPAEVTIGTGLVVTGSNTITAPAYPPSAAFKNLSIKVTGNSSATCAADFVTMATSGSSGFQTLQASGNINFATNGVNALDTGSLAGSNSWYAIWAVSTAGSTLAGFLASLSFTSPTMPTSYTYKARVGALVTSTSTSAQLMGTYQYGRQATYVVGLAATAKPPVMATSTSSAVGTFSSSTPTLVNVSSTNFVPSTAFILKGAYTGNYTSNTGGANIMVAPSTAWGAAGTGPAVWVWPYFQGSNQTGTGAPFAITLESANIAWASSNSFGALACLGWEDNI